MKQRGGQAGLRYAAGFVPECGYITGQYDGQHALLFTQQLGDRPAPRRGIVGDVAPQRVGRYRVAVGVIGVLDQQPVGAERQHINEAVTVLLRHAGIHDDWHLQPMRLAQLQFLTKKLLEAQRQVMAEPCAASVDHRTCS